MTPQIVEILVFALIAFFIINKLISILGTSDDDTGRYGNSKFGEADGMTDVTSTAKSNKVISLASIINKSEINYDVLHDPNDSYLKTSLEELYEKMHKFNPQKFIKNASKAWQVILKLLKLKSDESLVDLIDPRFMNEFKNRSILYKDLNIDKLPHLKISDITIFGNNVIIKVIVEVKDFVTEEWAFSKNINSESSTWLLCNIENFDQ